MLMVFQEPTVTSGDTPASLAALEHESAALTVADLPVKHPGWRCWHAPASGSYYAIQDHYPSRTGYQLRADTLAGLHEQIQASDAQATPPPVTVLGAFPGPPRATRPQLSDHRNSAA